jgi:long-chain acyl-CoA synthetase
MALDESVMSVDDAVRGAKEHYAVPEPLDTSGMTSLLDILQHAVDLYPSQPAVTSLDNTLSFQQLDELSSAFAAYLKRHTNL